MEKTCVRGKSVYCSIFSIYVSVKFRVLIIFFNIYFFIGYAPLKFYNLLFFLSKFIFFSYRYFRIQMFELFETLTKNIIDVIKNQSMKQSNLNLFLWLTL